MSKCPHGPQCASNVYYGVCWNLYCMWPTVKRNEPIQRSHKGNAE